jgi:hypothetical protein
MREGSVERGRCKGGQELREELGGRKRGVEFA